MDQVLLPAIYKHHRSDQNQHYPASHLHAKYNSTAQGVEGRSHKVDNMPRVQQLMHFIQNTQLYRVWESIFETIQEPGFHQFQGLKLFFTAKNLKGLSKGHTWANIMTRFRVLWQSTINETYISPNSYYDIGKEVCSPPCFLAMQDRAGQLEVLL